MLPSRDKPSKSAAADTAKASQPDAEEQAGEDDGDSDVEMAQIGYADSDGETDSRPPGSSSVKRADGTAPSSTSSSIAASKAAAAETATKEKTGKAPQKSSRAELEREDKRRKLREMMDVEDEQDAPGEQVPGECESESEYECGCRCRCHLDHIHLT